MTATAPIRRTLREADVSGIAELHRRVYTREYGLNEEFVARVGAGVRAAVAAGWPERGGAVWLVDHDGLLSGSLGLTDEGYGLGRLRWFVLEQPLRGRGLGRAMVDELLERVRAEGFARLELETFSALKAAAEIYKSVGFRLTWERERHDWGPPIVYQHYALDLA